MKRILCFFGIHWRITTGRFAMGDGCSCDICGRETYGFLLRITSHKLGKVK